MWGKADNVEGPNMPGSKPTEFPGAAQATEQMPDSVVFGATKTSTAQAPDTSNPPESVHLSIDLPDHANDVLSGLTHVHDWLL